MHFRRFKDVIALPLDRFANFLGGLPKGVARAIMSSFGAAGKAGYFWPGSHVRRTVTNFCLATGRSDPWPIYSGMVNNVENAALHYAKLRRWGRDDLLSQTSVDPKFVAEHQRYRTGKRGMIILVPHCIGAVLSSAGLHNFCPTTLLVREPKSPERCQLMVEYVKKLGPRYILSRNTPPATVMRNIARAVRDGDVVVGTTDLITPGADTIETRIFGQSIHSPVWPARIAAHFNIPIVPGFIHMEGSQIQLLGDEGYIESDIQKSTQRWISCFERWFLRFPSDWVFMFDKRWAHVLAGAAARTPDSQGTVQVSQQLGQNQS
jgi:lauroyl/myristoyl acyltransferase